VIARLPNPPAAADCLPLLAECSGSEEKFAEATRRSGFPSTLFLIARVREHSTDGDGANLESIGEVMSRWLPTNRSRQPIRQFQRGRWRTSQVYIRKVKKEDEARRIC